VPEHREGLGWKCLRRCAHHSPASPSRLEGERPFWNILNVTCIFGRIEMENLPPMSTKKVISRRIIGEALLPINVSGTFPRVRLSLRLWSCTDQFLSLRWCWYIGYIYLLILPVTRQGLLLLSLTMVAGVRRLVVSVSVCLSVCLVIFQPFWFYHADKLSTGSPSRVLVYQLIFG